MVVNAVVQIVISHQIHALLIVAMKLKDQDKVKKNILKIAPKINNNKNSIFLFLTNFLLHTHLLYTKNIKKKFYFIILLFYSPLIYYSCPL